MTMITSSVPQNAAVANVIKWRSKKFTDITKGEINKLWRNKTLFLHLLYKKGCGIIDKEVDANGLYKKS